MSSLFAKKTFEWAVADISMLVGFGMAVGVMNCRGVFQTTFDALHLIFCSLQAGALV